MAKLRQSTESAQFLVSEAGGAVERWNRNSATSLGTMFGFAGYGIFGAVLKYKYRK